MPDSPEKLVVMLDASSLNNSACEYMMHLQVVEGYRARLNSINMEFGTAVHKFRQVFRQKGSAGFGEGVRAAIAHLTTATYDTPGKRKEYLTDTNYLTKVCTEYAMTYETDTFKPVEFEGQFLLEQRFVLPYYSDDKVDILLAGTIDEIGRWYPSGLFGICDCKTTSAAFSNADSYLDHYQMSNQLLFYWTMLYRFAKHYPDSVFAHITQGEVALMIDGIFVGSKSEIGLKRSSVWIPPVQLREAYAIILDKTLMRIRDNIVAFAREGIIPMRTGIVHNVCEKKFGACQFFYHCAAPSEYAQQSMLDNYFIKQFYNPMEHQA